MEWIGNEEQIKKILAIMKDQFPDFLSGHDIVEEFSKYIGVRHLYKRIPRAGLPDKELSKYNSFVRRWYREVIGPANQPLDQIDFNQNWCAMSLSMIFQIKNKSLGPLVKEVEISPRRRFGFQGVINGHKSWEDKSQITNHPVPGDIVLYTFHKLSEGHRITHHTGIFVCWETFPHGEQFSPDPKDYSHIPPPNNDYFYTIEGNTRGPYHPTTSEGSGGNVALKRRSVAADGAYFAHPEPPYSSFPANYLLDQNISDNISSIKDPFNPAGNTRTNRPATSAARHSAEAGAAVQPCPLAAAKKTESKNIRCTFETVEVTGTNTKKNFTFFPIKYGDSTRQDRMVKIVSGYSENNCCEITMKLSDIKFDQCDNNHDKNNVFNQTEEGFIDNSKITSVKTNEQLKFKALSKTHSFEEVKEDFDILDHAHARSRRATRINEFYDNSGSHFSIVPAKEIEDNFYKEKVQIKTCSHQMNIQVKVYPDTKWENFKLTNSTKSKNKSRFDRIKVEADFKEDHDQNSCTGFSVEARLDYFFKIDTAGWKITKKKNRTNSDKLIANLKFSVLSAIKDIFELNNCVTFVQDEINKIALESSSNSESVKVPINYPSISMSNGAWGWEQFQNKKDKTTENDCGFSFNLDISLDNLVSFPPNSFVDIIAKYEVKEDYLLQQIGNIQLTAQPILILDHHSPPNVLSNTKLVMAATAPLLDDEDQLNLAIGKEIYNQNTKDKFVLRVSFDNPTDSSVFPLKFTVSKNKEEYFFRIKQGQNSFPAESDYGPYNVIAGSAVTLEIPLKISWYKFDSTNPGQSTTEVTCEDGHGTEITPKFTFTLTPKIDPRSGIYIEYTYNFTGIIIKDNSFVHQHRINKNCHGGNEVKEKQIFILRF